MPREAGPFAPRAARPVIEVYCPRTLLNSPRWQFCLMRAALNGAKLSGRDSGNPDDSLTW